MSRVTADVQNLAAAQAGLASPTSEMAATLQRHGVIPPRTVYVEK